MPPVALGDDGVVGDGVGMPVSRHRRHAADPSSLSPNAGPTPVAVSRTLAGSARSTHTCLGPAGDGRLVLLGGMDPTLFAAVAGATSCSSRGFVTPRGVTSQGGLQA